MNFKSNNQITVKGVILGDTQVGKTSLSHRYFTKSWNPITSTTISSNCQKVEMVIEGTPFTFGFWDTAGQERFRSISPIYYRGCHVAMIVFDLTNSESIKTAKSWVQELRRQGPIGVPLVLLGNKDDLVKERALSDESIKEFVQSIGADYFDVSALSGKNVNEAFDHAASLGFRYYRDQQQLSMSVNDVNPTTSPHEEKQEKSCC